MRRKRKRDVAHLWSDKRIIRFFRKNFDKKHYKNLRSIYLALCEIDSDFREYGQIKSFTKTVATYAGMNIDTIRPYLKALQKANIIDYYQERGEDEKFGNTTLIMYKWEEQDEEKIKSAMDKVFDQKTRSRENQSTGNHVPGKTSPFKNSKESLYKNSKEDNNISQKLDKGQQIEKDNGPNKNKNSSTNKAKKVVKLYHKLCPSLPMVRKITDKRKKMINARLKEYSLTEIKEAFQKAEKSDFLSGRNGAWNGCNIDWLLNPNNIIKVLEGKYTNSPSQEGKPSNDKTPEEIINSYFSSKDESFPIIKFYHFVEDTFADKNIDFNEQELAQAVIDFYSQIMKERDKHLTLEMKEKMISVSQLMEDYVSNLSEWTTFLTPKMLDINHKNFSTFRKKQAKEYDNMNRDPLTGKSYMQE